MFILLENERDAWKSPEGCPLDFSTRAAAEEYADLNQLIDVAIFEFKGFM